MPVDLPSPHSLAPLPTTNDRAAVVACFRRLATGWTRILRATSPSCAVWESPGGICLENFKSASGRQCDGVTRWMPALAAWAAQPENPAVLDLEDGATLPVRQVLRDAFVHATDPAHADFWGYPRPDQGNQRQVESSIVAWALWLSRNWLPAQLSPAERANIQDWLAANTRFAELYNNWALFIAVNHAARIALEPAGFHGDLEAIRRNLIVGNELYLGDGWMWDGKYHGIDYYNFWVNGSHHCYLRAMLPDYANPMLDRALREFQQRMQDLPYLIAADGRNLLFGRSLSYRFGWLNGLIAAHYLGISTVDPGLSRAMLCRNLRAWLTDDPPAPSGAMREKLTAAGSDGARSGYINCGHPYWGMQSFLCLALPSADPFWSAPEQPLPVERADFLLPRQGPGLVMQGFKASGEVRLYNLRNLNARREVVYQKFAYSTRFPSNAPADHGTVWDNQFGLRLADGTCIAPAELLEVDTNDGRALHLIARYQAPPASPDATPFRATVRTTLTIDGAAYTTEHQITAQGEPPAGAEWVEGGFTLPLIAADAPVVQANGLTASARAGGLAIESTALAGWRNLTTVTDGRSADGFLNAAVPPNMLTGREVHFVLRVALAPVSEGGLRLSSRHAAIGS